MQVTPEVKARVEAKIQETIDILMSKHNVVLPFPTILYDVRGTVAGLGDYQKWYVHFNPVLLMENIEAFIKRTVPHEMCHLAVDKVFPHAHRVQPRSADAAWGCRSKRSLHGVEWQSLMRDVGADPSRCHTYDVTNARVKQRVRYEYVCECGSTLMLGPKHHARLQQHPASLWHNKCKGKLLMFVDAPKPVVARPVPVATSNGGATKQQRAQIIYSTNKGLGRGAIISLIMSQIGVGKAHASTMYYNCQKGDK